MKWKSDVTINTVLFAIKHKDLRIHLHDIVHMCYIREEDTIFWRQYGWVIYLQCDISNVTEDELTIFLSTLIHKTRQADSIPALHPKPWSKEKEVWDMNETDHNEENYCAF